MNNEIKLKKEFRGGANSTSFTGRTEGEKVREKLNLNACDVDDNRYTVTIPDDTTSFNPSFFLGLFYDSIEKLKWEGFTGKYSIDLSNLSEELRLIILDNLEECERKAKNELSGITGID